MLSSDLVPLNILLWVDLISNGTKCSQAPRTFTNSLGMWDHMEESINSLKKSVNGPSVVILFTLVEVLFTARLLFPHEINASWSLASGILQMHIINFWELCPREMGRWHSHTTQARLLTFKCIYLLLLVTQSSPTLCHPPGESARLLCPWDSPGKGTGVGSHFLLWGIFPTQGLNPGLLHCRQMLYHLSRQT